MPMYTILVPAEKSADSNVTTERLHTIILSVAALSVEHIDLQHDLGRGGMAQNVEPVYEIGFLEIGHLERNDLAQGNEDGLGVLVGLDADIDPSVGCLGVLRRVKDLTILIEPLLGEVSVGVGGVLIGEEPSKFWLMAGGPLEVHQPGTLCGPHLAVHFGILLAKLGRAWKERTPIEFVEDECVCFAGVKGGLHFCLDRNSPRLIERNQEPRHDALANEERLECIRRDAE